MSFLVLGVAVFKGCAWHRLRSKLTSASALELLACVEAFFAQRGRVHLPFACAPCHEAKDACDFPSSCLSRGSNVVLNDQVHSGYDAPAHTPKHTMSRRGCRHTRATHTAHATHKVDLVLTPLCLLCPRVWLAASSCFAHWCEGR